MSTATLEQPTVETVKPADPVEAQNESATAVGFARSFVVKNDMVGKFVKGQCVSEYSFPLGTDFDRLTLQGAIRPAYGNETPGTVVAADAVSKPGVSITKQLQEANETIIRLSNRIAKQDEELETVKNARGPNYDPEKDEKMQQHFEKYRQTILILEGKNRSQADEIEAYRKKLNDIGNKPRQNR